MHERQEVNIKSYNSIVKFIIIKKVNKCPSPNPRVSG